MILVVVAMSYHKHRLTKTDGNIVTTQSMYTLISYRIIDSQFLFLECISEDSVKFSPN